MSLEKKDLPATLQQKEFSWKRFFLWTAAGFAVFVGGVWYLNETGAWERLTGLVNSPDNPLNLTAANSAEFTNAVPELMGEPGAIIDQTNSQIGAVLAA